MSTSRSEVTDLLQAWSHGDVEARDRLIPLVFDELRRIARHQFALEKPGHTLQPTALVNELYLRLVDRKSVQWQGRHHFFSVAAELIRRILVDHARKRQAGKRGSGALKISLDETLAIPAARDPGLLALDDALHDLEKQDPRASRIVELRIFAGLEHPEIAELLGISRSTVIRDWNYARLWLRRQLVASEDPEALPKPRTQG